MAMTDQWEPEWDLFVIEVHGKICLLAYSSAGQCFVTRNKHLGEPFGNGLIMAELEATRAFDLLDAEGLLTRTL